MIKLNSHVLKEVTLVIPSHYRHRFLQRNLNYHQNVELPILVADSTNIIFSGYKNYPNLSYFHYPNSPFHLKMADVFQHVETPYVAMCSDDDLMIPSSIKCCIEFLENNPEYASVQGHYVFFRLDNKLEMGPLYTTMTGYHINADTIEERVKQVINLNFHQHFCVHRTETLKYFFQENHFHYSDRSIGELALPLIASIHGKHKVIPVFHMAREGHLANERSNPYDIAESELIDELKKCIELLADYYCQNTGISISEGKKCIEPVFQVIYKKIRFNSKQKTNNYYPSFHQKIKKKIFQSIKTLVPEFVRFLRLTYRIGKIKGYPFFDKEAKKEWEIIKDLLLKHDIKSNEAFNAKKHLEVW